MDVVVYVCFPYMSCNAAHFISNTMHKTNVEPQVREELVSQIEYVKTEASLQFIDVLHDVSLELHNWKRQLPPQLDIGTGNHRTAMPHLLMTHLTYWWIFILLHRPFLSQSKSPNDRDVYHFNASFPILWWLAFCIYN